MTQKNQQQNKSTDKKTVLSVLQQNDVHPALVNNLISTTTAFFPDTYGPGGFCLPLNSRPLNAELAQQQFPITNMHKQVIYFILMYQDSKMENPYQSS